MPLAKCLICNYEFYVKPSHQLRGWGRYCSTKCRTKSQFKGNIFDCFTCKKNVYRSPLAIKKSKSGNYFCNKKCQTIWRNKILYSGENHFFWKNGESAYRRILKSSKRKEICLLCNTKDSRILIVHHLDKNRKNNDLKNLVWLCYNCHYLVHHFRELKDRLLNLII
jgi:hypothetical protein